MSRKIRSGRGGFFCYACSMGHEGQPKKADKNGVDMSRRGFLKSVAAFGAGTVAASVLENSSAKAFSGLSIEKLPPGCLKITPAQVGDIYKGETIDLGTLLRILSDKNLIPKTLFTKEVFDGIGKWQEYQKEDGQVIYLEFKSSPGEYSFSRTPSSAHIPLSKLAAFYVNPVVIQRFKQNSNFGR